ncbi:hypothetical protein GE09DRAFT_1158331 [Coniochaeta sp. 2T2.1]|nr:hypothetical protein GE09DRAFT_1158331 [Coniochaeta sp. 2T2.1]
MTSRPPLGVQQRQPQRSLSSSASGLNHQRPTHQRTLSQQHLPPSPIRKETTFADFGGGQQDTSDASSSQGRYAAQQRRGPGGSRLKLELSHDPADTITQMAISESPNALESSKPFTPSRMMPGMDGTSDLGDMSPHTSSRAPTTDGDAAPMPMPPRRPRFALAVPRAVQPAPTTATIVKKDTRPKPYTVEIPAAAPRYKVHAKPGFHGGGASSTTSAPVTTGFADFYPWTGNHPEDQFSENVIRHGYFDKAPVATSETSSAKNALFPMLKHKSGLHALSTIFTSVLGHRRHNGQITAPSTFKPPPRVTVTDTKRELWLKDLANPVISLRRLSRTIPHGIRGKVLLDQCLNKNVPVDRAIWLAKCVGANDIRAFKRKGVNGTFVMGGEAKWIRDWTVCVEQFVEAVFCAFGDIDWKAKVNYAVRLATHIYNEYLLDRDHYLDWILDSLEKSPQSKLPIWVLITQIYWKDMLHLRRTGRRLVAVFLHHLHEIQNNPDKDILSPLSSRLVSLLSYLMVLSPPSFVSPGSWFKYRDTLQSSIPAEDEQRQKLYRFIDSRNEHLVASCNKTPPAARQILVRTLDATLQNPMSDDMPRICWDITKDKTNLIRTLLEWCTSMYRPGVAKIYATSRILQSWTTQGVDITAAVLDFLDSDPIEQQGRKAAFYHLCCELARSRHFSVPRYFQWLMARGGVLASTDVDPDGPCATRLLVELPTHSLNTSQRNTRANMLLRAAYSVDMEAQDHEMAIKCLRQSLGMPVVADDMGLPPKPLPISKLAKKIARSSFALKADVGSWLQTSLVASFEQAAKESSHPMEISSTTFNAVRTVFEAAEDFSMLAGVLKSVSSVSNVEILASCADTVSRHVLIFAALDAARGLFDTLYVRLRTTAEEQGIGARPLLASLSCLASRMPEKQETAAQLKKDLAQTDRNNPVDACSPVSDNMGARLQEDDADLQEEIEKNLMSGTVLDRATMNRLFEAVVTRLNTWWGNHAEKQRRYGMLLARLRGFDQQHFDSLMAKWIHHLRAVTNRPSILRMFPLLMGLGCLNFPLLLASTYAEQPGTGPSRSGPNTAGGSVQIIQVTYRTRYCQQVLGMVTKPPAPDDLLSQEECYRIAIMQDQALKDNSPEILGLVRQALAEYSLCRDKGDLDTLPLDSMAEREHVINMLRSLVLRDSPGVIKALSIRSPDPHVAGWIDCIATKLLIPTAEDMMPVNFDQILELTNEFTLPFCQLKIALTLSSADQNNPDAAERLQTHLDLFTKAMDNAIDAKNTSWTGMLSSLSPEITHHLKSRAQTRFLDLLPSMRNSAPPPSGDAPQAHGLQMAQNLLLVIDAIIRGGSMGRPPQLVPAMVDKLVDLWEVLSSPAIEAGCKIAVLNHWLPALLALVTLHTSTFDSSKAGFEVRARAVIVLCGLLQELGSLPPSTFLSPSTTPNISTAGPPILPLPNRIFDLACLLVDSLNDETRSHCIRLISNTSDVRLRYIFSFPRNPSENLMLSHRDKPPSSTSNPGGAGGPRPPVHPGQLLGTPASLWGGQMPQGPERLTPFYFRRWEMLNEPTPVVGENDTAVSLGLFEARKVL